jgi:uncharacterized membrane protein YraQ (UPF0718 family)
MDGILELLAATLAQAGRALFDNWPYLAASIAVSALLKLGLDARRVSAFLLRHRRAGVWGATAVAVATPLCSCGTMAVVLGMMASTVPWAPIVAFMVASPLTSPEELVYSAGLFGWPFALAFFGSSIALGLAGGLAALVLEGRGWLADQSRLAPDCRACAPGPAAPQASVPAAGPARRLTLPAILRELRASSPRLLILFVGFAFIGYLVNRLVPASLVPALFGSGRTLSVPLAATLGLPFYLNTEASLPLLRSLIDAGMSQGAALAFLITGAGTSLGAVAGALTIARWRVVGLVVATLWVGAVVFGAGYDAFLAAAGA